MRRAAELVESPERENAVCGSWICQGRIDPRVIEAMQKMAPNVHPMTPERRARIEEAAKHPDENDLASAREFIVRTIGSLNLQVST
jgi:hypothetical protein